MEALSQLFAFPWTWMQRVSIQGFVMSVTRPHRTLCGGHLFGHPGNSKSIVWASSIPQSCSTHIVHQDSRSCSMQGALGDGQPGTGVCRLVVVSRQVAGLMSSRLRSPRFPVIVALFLETTSHHRHHCRRLVHAIYNYHDQPKDPQTPRLELSRFPTAGCFLPW